MADNYTLARVFLGKKGGDIVTSHFHNLFAHVIRTYYKGRVNPAKLEKKMFTLLVEAAASAMCSMLFTWATSDMPYPAGEMATHSHDITKGIFKRYL